MAQSDTELNTSLDPTAHHRVDAIRVSALIGVVGAAVSIAYYLWLYAQTSGWQMLAAAGGVGVTGLVLAGALLLHRQKRYTVAGYLITLAIILGYGIPDLVYADAGLYYGVGGVILIILVGVVIMPRKWWGWGLAALLFGSYVLLVGMFEPLPRYDMTRFASLGLFLAAITIFMALVLIWYVISAFRLGTIRARLIMVFVSIVFLAIAITSGVSAVGSLRSGRNQVLNQLESVATLKESEIEMWVQDLRLEIGTLVTGENAVLQLGLLSQEARSLVFSSAAHDTLVEHFQHSNERTKRFEELFLMNAQGVVLVSTNRGQEDKILDKEYYFSEGLNGLYVSAPIFSTYLGEMTIVVSHPVVDEQGTVWGVLAGRATMDTLSGIMLERAGLGETGETYLIGLNRVLLTKVRAGEPEHIRSDGADAVLTERTNGTGLYDNYAGIPVIGVYRWIPELQMALLAEQAQSEAFRAIYTTLILNIIVAVVAVLFAAGIATVFVNNSVANPLTRLIDVTTRVAAGDLAHTAEVKRADEIGTLAIAFNAMTRQLRDVIGSLEHRVQERTAQLAQRASQLQAVAEVSRAASSVLEVGELLDAVVNLTLERFELYYVGIFLVDEERRYAWLRAGTGDAGREMLARQHKLAIGGTSMIGWCVQHGEARIALDVGEDAVRFSNPLLPQTRSELALPLRARDEIIGAMTVQSTAPEAFAEEDILVLQTMADQVANAITNAQLYEDAQTRLDEITRLQRQYLREAWAETVAQRSQVAFEYTLPGAAVSDAEILPLERQALAQNRLVVAEESFEENKKRMTVVKPLTLRGQVIGTLGAQASSADRPLAGGETEELTLVLEEVGEQMALALENVRLIEESHDRAVREQQLREVSAKMRDAASMDAVIRVALQEFSKHLNPAHAFVHLEVPKMEAKGE